MLPVLPPMFKPVNNLICCKTGLMWVVKRATSLFNSFAAMLQDKLQVFCCPFFRTLTRTKFKKSVCPGFPSYLYYNFTLSNSNPDNSNLSLTRSNFCFPSVNFVIILICFPSVNFVIILPSITRTMF